MGIYKVSYKTNHLADYDAVGFIKEFFFKFFWKSLAKISIKLYNSYISYHFYNRRAEWHKTNEEEHHEFITTERYLDTLYFLKFISDLYTNKHIYS